MESAKLDALFSRAVNGNLTNPYAKMEVVRGLEKKHISKLIKSILMDDYDPRIKKIILLKLDNFYDINGVKEALENIAYCEDEQEDIRDEAVKIYKKRYQENLHVFIG
jgi:hypothetical protein